MTPTEGIFEILTTLVGSIIAIFKTFGIYILIALLIGYILTKIFGKR